MPTGAQLDPRIEDLLQKDLENSFSDELLPKRLQEQIQELGLTSIHEQMVLALCYLDNKGSSADDSSQIWHMRTRILSVFDQFAFCSNAQDFEDFLNHPLVRSNGRICSDPTLLTMLPARFRYRLYERKMLDEDSEAKR